MFRPIWQVSGSNTGSVTESNGSGLKFSVAVFDIS